MERNQKTEESAESGVLLKLLVNKVANMRGLQKKYFKTRDPKVLKEAKQAEQDVDRVIEQIKKPNLF